MSPARCSSCHCYSRSCPVGLPNHRTVSNVGSQCTMNPAGRHYRDQADTSIPTCDYENCNFFSTSEFSSLPYPTDVTLGPVSENPQSSQQSADLSLILQLLQQQKEESEKTNNEIRQTNSNMAALQHQVNSLIPSSSPPGPVLSTPVTTRTTTVQSMTYTAPTFTSTTTAPNVVTSAAAGLTAALQGGLGHLNNYGYSGLTMDQLRANPGIVSQAAATLTAATNDVPPLNPLHGMGLALGQPAQPDQVINSVEQLFRATTVNKQLRAFEFASTGQFPYKSSLKQDNCNAISFAYGSFKHLHAVKTGLINMSDSEFLSRLKHLRNVFEIACMSSPLSSFAEPSWLIAREYDSRVTADIESGVKSWDTLANGLETDSIYMAKETVELRNRAKKPPKDPKSLKDEKVITKKGDSKKTGCTTYNTHRSSEGCYWEAQNKGESCIFKHFCSWCKLNRDVEEKHKVLHCEFKAE